MNMLYTSPITASEDIIDSRDVIGRIEYLDGFDDEEALAELAALKALAEQCENGGVEDWQYGATLIRDSYFVTYAQEYAEDVVEGMSDARWPFTHIDWEAAADELKMDYTSVDFDGVTYWVR